MQTITLELLRHGPAHNQLLSPLTPYLALCGNHGAVTLHLPFEHNQILHRLRALEYQDSDENRLFELQALSREMGEILANIPGLTAELNRRDSGDSGGITHLRLILSASELALLPFELAQSPDGCPGTGQKLSLQPQRPICITREIRRAPDPLPPPPKAFKILFAAASPSDVGTVPLEAHLLALRKAIDPWVAVHSPQAGVAQHLELLPNASIRAIEEACARDDFTHVHILAHGVRREFGEDHRFMLALHDADTPLQTDYVDGRRLATALRATRGGSGDGSGNEPLTRSAMAQPMIVTLASCNSGGIGSVAGAGASLAHALHEAGIPMVIAGQFPLSFPGSVRLVEMLYEGLLWAKDPRWLLHGLRRSLHSQLPKTHDWASLVAYATLSPEFDRQWCDLRIGRTQACIDAAMKQVDNALNPLSSARSEPDTENLTRILPKVELAIERLEKLKTDMKTHGEARICGLLGSSKKRYAEACFLSGNINVVNFLREARDHYRESFRLDRSQTWAFVQHLSLVAVLARHQATSPVEQETIHKTLAEQMAIARHLAREDILCPELNRRIWAHGDLIELSLLALLEPENESRVTILTEEAFACAEDLLKISGGRGFETYSTVRQIRRYYKWYNKMVLLPDNITDMAKRIDGMFPDQLDVDWS